MRKLNIDDAFDFMIMLDELKLKEKIKEISVKQNKEKVGFDIIWKLILTSVAKENRIKVYEFLSGPFELDVNEIRTMGLMELSKGFREIASIDEWQSFFNSLQQTT